MEEWIGEKGMRVNMSKIKVMKCRYGAGQFETTGKDPCGVCRKGVRNNSIYCSSCKNGFTRGVAE